MTLSKLPQTEHIVLPPLTLALGPAGSGKTGWALARFIARRGRTVLIASSSEQADTRAEQIAAQSSLGVADVRPCIFTFRSLANELTRASAQDGSRVIGRAFQRMALADVVKHNLREDDYFGSMLHAPGFVPALAERIRDWKLAYITPDILEATAQPAATLLQDPSFARKAGEMARLFRAYEMFLTRNRLRDEEDYLRLAAEQATAGIALPGNAELVLVDGFYRFNRAQRRLLAALAGRGLQVGKPELEVAVTLPYDARRPLLFAAPERTLITLRREFTCREETLHRDHDDRPAALVELGQHLFSGTGPHIAPSESAPVVLFDAPNPYVEAEMVARALRRLIDSGSYAWSDCAVILRAMGDYAPILAAVFERYGIPLGVDGPETLAENPLIKTVLHLLAVIRHGWQRDDVLAFLKSGYTEPDKLSADELRRRARAAGVREGRERWLELIAKPDVLPVPVAETLQAMAHFDAMLTERPFEPIQYAETIKEIITAFGLDERINLGEPTRQERDRVALREAQEVLEALAQMLGLAGRATLPFTAFHDELTTVWQTTSALTAATGDVVHVAEPYDARERNLKVAVVMGLTERVFPRRVTEDPFLRDEERRVLRQIADLDLEEQKGRADDERFLFYLAVTAPSERLMLSYPRATGEADTLPSFFLDEVRAILEPSGLTTISRTLADVAPRPEDAVSASDRLLAACADLFDPNVAVTERTDTMRQAALRLRPLLQDATLGPIATEAIRSRRWPPLPKLRSPELISNFCGRDPVYGVTELETYGRCPFQYLLRHVLKLRQEDEAHTQTEGALLHGVLRRYFRRRARKTVEVNAKSETGERMDDKPADAAQAMRAELRRLLDETLAQTSLDISPHRLLMTQRLLGDALDGFVEREQRFSAQFGMVPAHFELSFGYGGPGPLTVEDEDRAIDGEWEGEPDGNKQAGVGLAGAKTDRASCAEPLELLTPDGGPGIAIRGVIDRVDLDTSGRRALILDYKLSKPPEHSEIQRGASLQMPLYLLAMERLFGKVGAVACYDSTKERGRRRFHRLEHVNVRQFGPVLPLEDGTMVTPLNRDQFTGLLKTAEATAIRLARAITAGDVEATPGDHCRSCAYGDVCRTTLINGHDGETQD